MDYNFEKKSENTMRKLYNFSAKAILLNIVSWWISIMFIFVPAQTFAMGYSYGLSFVTVLIATAIAYASSLIINWLLFKLLEKYNYSW